MAGIISNVDSDIQRLRKLKNEIEEVKKALKGINIKVDINIAKGLQSQLISLMGKYDALVDKIAEAEGKIMLSTKRINDAAEKIIQAQEKVSKAANVPTQTGNANTQTTTAATANIQAQAKAYEDLKAEINDILGTRDANVKRMVDEMNAIRLINAEIKKITKSQGESSSLSSAQQKRLEQLNNSLLTHKTVLSEVRQTLNNNVKLDNAAATSMNGLSQSLSRMRIAYRELTEEERNSPIGKELLASINQADTKIKELDATIGNHQRNVGNYASGWNGLGMSVQQIVRELPAAKMGLNMFFLAISNNLPILVDEINRAKVANEALKASGQSSTPVWKQVASSLFSWQSAMMVGITLLTMYGKDISDWVTGLFKAKSAIKELLSAEQEMALARKSAWSSIAKEQTQLDILYNKLKNVTLSTTERNAAVREWVKNYKAHSDILDGEKVSIDKLKQSYAALSKEIYNKAVADKYSEKAAELAVKIADARTKANYQLKDVLEAQAKSENAQREYEEKQRQYGNTDNYDEQQELLRFKMAASTAKNQLNSQQEIQEQLKKNLANLTDTYNVFIEQINKYQPFAAPKEGTYDYWQQQVEIADNALKQIDSQQKRLLDNALKNKENLYNLGIDKSIVDSYRKAVKDKAEAEKELKVYGSSSKQEKESEKLCKQQEKYNLFLDKQALEQQRSAEDLQMKVDEARIKAMDEGSAKTIAEMELNFEKEMQAVDRQKEDALRKKIDDARAAWEANPQNKGKSFDATGIELSDGERKYYDELYKAVIVKNEKAYSNLANQYLSYTDQRLSIEKKFNDDIAVLQEVRKKAEAKGDTDEIFKIDRLIAKATADKGKELMKHDFDVLKQSPEYIRAFEDLKNTSSETLKSLLQQLENAKSAAPTVLNPEDLREYTTTIQEIMDELDSRNPFQALADRQKELVEAEQELAKAKKQLDAVNNGAKIVTGVKSTSLGADGKIKIENTYLSAAEALRKYNAAKDKAQKANNNFVKAERTAREKVDELADAIKGIGDAIGGQTGEIISLMGDVALFATGTIDGISKVAQTGANAISAVEKASVILGIISTAIQLLQKIGEIGSNKAFKQYEAYAEKLKEINALTDAVNQYRIAALEAQQAESNWFSTDNLKNLRDYKKLHNEVYKSYVDKAGESQAIYKNESGGGWLTGAFNWVMGNLSALSWWDKWKNIWGQGDYSKGQTAAINNLRIETRKKSKGFLGTGIGGKSQKTEDLVTWAKNQGLGDLFDNEGLINKELAQSLIDNYGNKLVGQTRETLESLIELREKYDEYIEQLHEYVSSLYEPLVDNLVDSLWDWLDNGKDALKSFKDYASDTFRDIVSDMMRTIVLDKVVGSFSDDIAALYEEYAKGAINEAELMKKVAEKTNGLVDNYEQNIPTLQNIMEQVNSYLQSSGIDLSQSGNISQESSKKGFATASQDSIDELSGRFTALQLAGEEIKNQSTLQTQSLNLLTVKTDTLISVNTETRNIADETRDLIAQSYLELVQISENTGNSAKYLKDIKADIAEVKKNTKGLSSK